MWRSCQKSIDKERPAAYPVVPSKLAYKAAVPGPRYGGMRQLSLACIRLGNHGFPAPASFYLDAIKAFDEELDELMGRYASYEQLATIIRHRFQAPRETLKELFARMLFNILCGNTDDHARNHAAFWNRKGEEATQAMLILGQQRASQIALCLKAAPLF